MVDVDVKLSYADNGTSTGTAFDSGSRFKLVNMFGVKIRSFSLFDNELSPKLIMALDHMANVCSNLTEFRYDIWERPELDRGDRNWTESNLVLRRLFSDKERAAKFRKLTFGGGDLEYDVLEAIFENCPNVIDFEISSCSQFGDEHFAKWACSGVKLEELWLDGCDNISDEGLIQILMKSGPSMEVFTLKSCPRVTENSYRVLGEYCRYVEDVDIEHDMKALISTKCFRKL